MLTYKTAVSFIDEREPFTIARYGDGEMHAILGHPGANCDGHEYFKALGDDLRITLTLPRKYYYARGKMIESNGMSEWIDKYCANLEWSDADLFLKPSINGNLRPLTKALGKRRIMGVGGQYLREWHGIDWLEFITVPLVNAYLDKERIKDEILHHCYNVDLIAFSAGMLSKVLIWELFPHLGATHSLIDFGSLWDVYTGYNSRKYARRMTEETRRKLTAQNFGEK